MHVETLLSRLSGVIRCGEGWKACCPAHADSTPSLKIDVGEGGAILLHCFGGCASGSVLHALDLELADLFPDKKANGHATPVAREPERVTGIPPTNTSIPAFVHATHGKATSVHVYKSTSNQLLGYVLRFDKKDGKAFCPLTWSASDGWQFKTWSKPRPLYGQDRLLALPDATVIVCEGEKAADAAALRAPKNPCLTWPGGAGSVRHADFEPLRGRGVILWPDADKPGREAMDWLGQHLLAMGCKVRMVNTEGLPDGFDAADLKDPLRNWLEPRLQAYTPRARPEAVQPTVAPAVEPVAPPVKPASVTPITEARTRRQEKPDTDPEPLPAAYSHDALATAFTAAHPDWRHVAAWGKWLTWSGTYWREDVKWEVENLAREVCRAMANDARVNGCSPATIRSIVHANTIMATVKLARSDPAHARTAEHWDSDPWLLNTPGGIVDLRDGSLRPGRPQDHQTKTTHATPMADSQCPHWVQFLIDATRGNGELIEFLQRVVGYCLTGSIREHALFFFHGNGGNGKGTFLNTLAWILGDYAWIASMDMLTEQHNPQHLTFQAALKGRRLVVAQEVEEGKRWAEAKLNALTGGDPITANYMRHDPFTFEPTHKFAISGNHKPILRNVGDAIRRRLHLIPFTNKPLNPDKELADKLRAEADGILRWAVEGCRKWQDRGLQPPEIVRAETHKYLASQDSPTTWSTECCDADADTLKAVLTPLKTLFDSYKRWCQDNGEPELGRKRFVEAMETRGYEVVEQRKHYFIRGMRLRPEEDAGPHDRRFPDD